MHILRTNYKKVPVSLRHRNGMMPKLEIKKLYTLESGIVVPVRLLIFENFSHQYFLILASRFIDFYNKIKIIELRSNKYNDRTNMQFNH